MAVVDVKREAPGMEEHQKAFPAYEVQKTVVPSS